MDFPIIRAGIGSWLTTETGLDVYWKKRPQNWQGGAWIECRISSVSVLGKDEVIGGKDTDELLYLQQFGIRKFVLEIHIMSHTFSDDEDSLFYADKVLGSVRRYHKTFFDAGIGFSEILGVHDLDSVLLRRDVHVVAIDLSFFTEAYNRAQAGISYIEHIEHEGTIERHGTIGGEI